MQLVIGNHICIWIKACPVSEVAQNISCGVPNLFIRIGKLLQNCLGNPDIRMIIGRSNPQTENICTILLNDFIRHDAVAQRLGHLSAFAVYNPAMRTNCLIRSFALIDNGSQQG